MLIPGFIYSYNNKNNKLNIEVEIISNRHLYVIININNKRCDGYIWYSKKGISVYYNFKRKLNLIDFKILDIDFNNNSSCSDILNFNIICGENKNIISLLKIN